MGVYRETYTKPLPKSAETFIRAGEQLARWTDRNGRLRTAKVTTSINGAPRVILACKTHTARYRDGSGVVRKVGTGCRTKDAAESVLSELRGRAELVRAKVISPAQDAMSVHADVPIGQHFDAYEDHLTAKGCDPRRMKMVRARLKLLAEKCSFARLPDLAAGPLERWLVFQGTNKMSAAARNSYRESAVGFCNWCCRTHRLESNPFRDVPLANVKADRKHQRRALTEEELKRLILVATVRPLAEYGRETVKEDPDPTKKKRSNWTRKPLTFETIIQSAEVGRSSLHKHPELIAELEQLGRERALVYKALVLTGLRKGELASLTVGRLDLDGPYPTAILNAADEKNRKGSEIPLRLDLVADIRGMLDGRLRSLQEQARLQIGSSLPIRLPPAMPVFNVPSGLIRILDRDLEAAGIAKKDERGRVVDVHALRVTFGTHLSKGGVSLRTAQAAMRHSKPDLTANVYTDPKLLDVAGALNSLPSLPLVAPRDRQALKATGTACMSEQPYQGDARKLVPKLVHAHGNPSVSLSLRGNQSPNPLHANCDNVSTKNLAFVERKTPLTSPVSGVQQKRAKGLEPSTFTLAT